MHYLNIHTNEVVHEDEALEYVTEHEAIKLTDKTSEEFKEMLVQWYFSGDWTMEMLDEEKIIGNKYYDYEVVNR